MKTRAFRYDHTKGNTPSEVFDYNWETVKFERNGIYTDVIQVEKTQSDSLLEGAIEIQDKANKMKYKNPNLNY